SLTATTSFPRFQTRGQRMANRAPTTTPPPQSGTTPTPWIAGTSRTIPQRRPDDAEHAAAAHGPAGPPFRRSAHLLREECVGLDRSRGGGRAGARDRERGRGIGALHRVEG